MQYVDPTKETFAVFRDNDREGPIHMLNLVRFREKRLTQTAGMLQGPKLTPPTEAKVIRCFQNSAAGSYGAETLNSC